MGRIYKPVKIKGKKCEKIVVGFVDTGADRTILSNKIAKKMKLKLYGKFLAISATNHEILGKYTDIELITEDNGRKAIIPVGVTDEPFDDDEGIEVILGIDFLQESETVLRFEKR